MGWATEIDSSSTLRYMLHFIYYCALLLGGVENIADCDTFDSHQPEYPSVDAYTSQIMTYMATKVVVRFCSPGELYFIEHL